MAETEPELIDKLGDLAARAGLRSITMLAWRDLDDPEAGGSEVHASTVASLWAKAGIDVTIRTSHAPGHPLLVRRDGYRVIRKAGRYMVFPRAALTEALGRHGPRDGLVEIWNGMPFFSPLWAHHVPRVTWLHHVHDQMWFMTLPPRLARLGYAVEFTLAPPIYRRTPIVTLSESSKRELVERLRFRPARVHVVPPGVDERFRPGGERSPTPLVAAVGRLVPVKRWDRLVDAVVPLRERLPGLELVIVGEGYEREALEARIRAHHADDWITLPGRLTDDALIDLYRRSWVVAASSAHEGWGMTITEAAACGTPAVATRIAGHLDSVVDGTTGLLVDEPEDLGPALASVLGDPALRARLSAGAVDHAARFTWGTTAYRTLEILAAEALRKRGPAPRP